MLFLAFSTQLFLGVLSRFLGEQNDMFAPQFRGWGAAPPAPPPPLPPPLVEHALGRWFIGKRDRNGGRVCRRIATADRAPAPAAQSRPALLAVSVTHRLKAWASMPIDLSD